MALSEKSVRYKLPFGFSVYVYSHYINGFKPYPATYQRCRFLKIQWMKACRKSSTGSIIWSKDFYIHRIQKDF